MSRIQNAKKNLIIVTSTRIISLIITYVVRIFFVRILGGEKLGINSVFSSILMILSIAEFGFGEAIAFSLYKPLKDNDREKIGIIMNYVKKAYYVIALIVLTMGVMIMPFLKYIIGESINIPNIYLIYFLIVFHSASSYIGSSRRLILSIDQKKHKDALAHLFISVVFNIIHIFLLYLFKSYLLYLFLQIIYVLTDNFFGNKVVEREYPWLFNQKYAKIDNVYKKKIHENIFAIILQKIQAIFNTSIPPIVLSIYYGPTNVGVYSNYMFVINMVLSLIVVIYDSIIGSVGNAIVTLDSSKTKDLFRNINFVSFWLTSVSSIGLMVLLNNFIYLSYGVEYILNQYVVFLSVFYFYLMASRQPINVFKNSYGLYRQDKYKPIVNLFISLIITIFLIKPLGSIGVLLSLSAPYLLINSWIEPMVLFKYGFHSNSKKHIIKYYLKLLLTFIIGASLVYLFSLLSIDNKILEFFIEGIITFIIINGLMLLLYKNTSEFAYFKKMIIKTKTVNVK